MRQGQTQTEQIAEDRTLQISDRGKILELNYAGLEAFHSGDSWWGCAVGFRAMQCAARELSNTELWNRQHLYIVSGHPGPGVLDAIEYVTGCIGRKHFRKHDDAANSNGCSRDMKFEWWVSNGKKTIHINLRPDFVPESFFELLERLGTDEERYHDRFGFDEEKNRLSNILWSESLDAAFYFNFIRPLDLGEIPHA